jgi:hypothetical protein
MVPEFHNPTPTTESEAASRARTLSESEAAFEAQRIITEAFRTQPAPTATAYRDTSPIPAVGDARPVQQPDTRTVPPWATGIAVASLGIGAGATGIGCAGWLFMKGLSVVTITGVLAVLAPFVGVAVAALAVGAAVCRTKAGTSQHVYQGTVIKNTAVTTHTRGLLSRTRNELHS